VCIFTTHDDGVGVRFSLRNRRNSITRLKDIDKSVTLTLTVLIELGVE